MATYFGMTEAQGRAMELEHARDRLDNLDRRISSLQVSIDLGTQKQSIINDYNEFKKRRDRLAKQITRMEKNL